MRRGLMLLVVLLWLHAAAGQEEERQLLESRLERLAEQWDGEADLEALLPLGAGDRVSVNRAGAGELACLPGITAPQVEALLQYRKLLGPLVHLYELQAVPNWDSATIRRLLPYILVEPVQGARLGDLLQGGEHLWLLRYGQTLENANEGSYAGGRAAGLFQYKYTHPYLRFGITAEQDAGEPLGRGHGLPVDFLSGHLFLTNLAPVTAFALGDHTVSLGQGLIQAGGLGAGRSADVLGVKRQGPWLRPHRGAGEAGFHRGLALSLGSGKFKTLVFASSLARSAGPGYDSNSISGFRLSGLHRTAGELAGRHAVGHRVLGGALKWEGRGAHLGLQAVGHQFSRPLRPPPYLYNNYRLQGDRWANASIDYSLSVRNLHLFGELAADAGKRLAGLTGILASLAPRLDLSLLYRHYPAAFISVAGQSFGETGLPANERGLFTGLAYRTARRARLSAYADLYAFPWLRYRVDAPARGRAYFLQWDWQPSKTSGLYLRLQAGTREHNRGAGRVESPVAGRRLGVRLHFNGAPAPGWEVEGRAETVRYGKEGAAETSLLGYLELTRRHPRIGAMNIRFLFFRTGGVDSRLYAYEQDVRYRSSLATLSGRGIRTYVNLNYKLTRRLQAWLYLARTHLLVRSNLSNSLETSIKPHNSELRLQLIYTWKKHLIPDF